MGSTMDKVKGMANEASGNVKQWSQNWRGNWSSKNIGEKMEAVLAEAGYYDGSKPLAQ